MSITYGVSGSSPFADFAVDIENLVINYIYTKWSIADPAKPAAMQAASQNIEFRPGFDRGRPTYQILCIQTDTEVLEQDASQRSWKFLTRLEITVISNRMGDIDNVKPQLGYMEREVQRILNQYATNDIPGIAHLDFRGQARVYDDIISGTNVNQSVRGASTARSGGGGNISNWAASRWKTRIYAAAEYYKDNILS